MTTDTASNGSEEMKTDLEKNGEEKRNPKGPWINRFATKVLTFAFAVLIFWVLGFLVQDIRRVPGPEYAAIEEKHVDQVIVDRAGELGELIKDAERKIATKKGEQQILGDSSQSLQRTINQLIELRRLSVEKEIDLSEADQGDLSVSLSHFLQNQKEYQALNKRLAEWTAEKNRFEEERRELTSQIEEQRLPAREEHQQRLRTHRLKLAGLQLVILIPLLILSGILLAKNRESLHLPFFLAFGGATLLKVGLVMHEYFPTQYFKYVFIGALLLVVGKLLFHFIRVAAFPKVQWLRKQYREAYEHFLCPVCEFPIRTGPRKYLYWTRRTLKKMVVPGDSSYEDENYSCPSCGTDLYEECSSCGKVRHSLLPHCRHCGDEKEAF